MRKLWGKSIQITNWAFLCPKQKIFVNEINSWTFIDCIFSELQKDKYNETHYFQLAKELGVEDHFHLLKTIQIIEVQDIPEHLLTFWAHKTKKSGETMKYPTLTRTFLTVGMVDVPKVYENNYLNFKMKMSSTQCFLSCFKKSDTLSPSSTDENRTFSFESFSEVDNSTFVPYEKVEGHQQMSILLHVNVTSNSSLF